MTAFIVKNHVLPIFKGRDSKKKIPKDLNPNSVYGQLNLIETLSNKLNTAKIYISKN